MKPEEVKSLSAFIRTFNPVAKIVETQRSRLPLSDVVNSRSFSMQRAEQMKGWLARARGDVQPESEEYAVAFIALLLHMSKSHASSGMAFLPSFIAPVVLFIQNVSTQSLVLLTRRARLTEYSEAK
jgi:G3E family GTPase